MKALGRRPELVALGAVFIGVALVLAKLVVGVLTGSLGILSEAVHSLFDLAASTFTLVAVRTARTPADREHPYGHGRVENVAAFAEGIVLLITAVGVAGGAASLWPCVAGDILIARPPAGAENQLRAAIRDVPGVREVRSVRVRRSGPNLIGDASIATGRMLSVEAAGALADEVKRTARSVLPTLDLSVLVEGQALQGDLVERIHAAAARNGGVRDLHNVTVEREADGP